MTSHRVVPHAVVEGLDAILELIPNADDHAESEIRIRLMNAHSAGRKQSRDQLLIAIDGLRQINLKLQYEVERLRKLHEVITIPPPKD